MTHDLAASAGALLTLASCGILAAGGCRVALRLLGETAARENTLELATAWLLSTTALGVGMTLALGACGALRIELALPLALVCTAALLASGSAVAAGVPGALAGVCLCRPPQRLADAGLAGGNPRPAADRQAAPASGLVGAHPPRHRLRGAARPDPGAAVVGRP